MDKKELQDQELEQVSGGTLPYPCPNCHKAYWADQAYPEGWLLKQEPRGCGHITYYKCPNCGYTWTV